jgi:hypothetical protein
LDDVFLAVAVNGVLAEATFLHERNVSADFAGVQEKLSAPDFLWDEIGFGKLKLLVGELDAFLYVRTE